MSTIIEYTRNEWTSWAYNVEDKYKGMSVEDIKKDLQKNALPFAVGMQQLQGDFNFSCVIRSANAFGAKEVFYFGKKRYDRRGAVGTNHYTDVNYLSSFEEFQALKSKYTLVAVDNVPGSVPVESFVWPENPLMIFGEEGTGINSEYLNECKHIISITQRGSVRSLNAAAAATAVMYDFVIKYNNCR